MKLSLLMLCFGAVFTGQVAQACYQPLPAPTLPAGLDGKLPAVNPDLRTPTPPSPTPVTITPTPAPQSTITPTPSPTVTPTPTNPGSCYGNWTYFSNTGTLAALNDADTDKVYGVASTPAPAAWSASAVYNVGDIVSFEGVTYKAKWWTQNEMPGQAWGAWEAQSALSGPQLWSRSKVYNAGDLVIWNDRLYQARWWTQNNQPDLAGSPWEDKGVAPVSANRPAQFTAKVTKQTSGEMDVSVDLGSFIYPVQYVYRATELCTSTLSIEGEQPANMVPPRTERWEIHLDGKVVAIQQGPYLMPVPAVAPPPPPVIARNPDQSCSVAPGTVVASFSSAKGGVVAASTRLTSEQAKGSYLSVWLCNGDLCRPSPLLRAYKFGNPTHVQY